MSVPSFDPSEPFPGATRAAWQALARDAIAKAGAGRTPGGLPIEALHTGAEWPHDTGLPGAPPFTRGAREAGEAAGPIVRSRIDCADPAAANRRLREEVAGGAGAVLIVLDEAFRSGDFSRPAGLGGVALRSGDDAATLLDGVGAVRIDFASGAAGAALGRILGEIQERRPPGLQDALRGTLGADPLGALARFGSHPGEPGAAIAEAAGLAAHLDGHVAGVRVFSVAGAPCHTAGATPAQEVAAALAAGVAYLRALTDAGLALARAARHISFTLAVDADFLASIAKLRAFRRVWARVLDASGGAGAIAGLTLDAVTSPRMMAAKDPHTNLLRTTCAAAAAIIGGADALTVLPFTERIGSSALARRLARNSAIILCEEADLARVLDPAGGSFALERLSEALALEAWQLFREIEGEGGLLASLLAGELQARIAAAAAARRARIAAGDLVLVGVTKYAPPRPAALKLDAVAPPMAPRAPRHPALANLASLPRTQAPPLGPVFDDAGGEP